MLDGEIHKELLRQTNTPKKALELTTNTEMRIQNQLRIAVTSVYNISTPGTNPRLQFDGVLHNSSETLNGRYKILVFQLSKFCI